MMNACTILLLTVGAFASVNYASATSIDRNGRDLTPDALVPFLGDYQHLTNEIHRGHPDKSRALAIDIGLRDPTPKYKIGSALDWTYFYGWDNAYLSSTLNHCVQNHDSVACLSMVRANKNYLQHISVRRSIVAEQGGTYMPQIFSEQRPDVPLELIGSFAYSYEPTGDIYRTFAEWQRCDSSRKKKSIWDFANFADRDRSAPCDFSTWPGLYGIPMTVNSDGHRLVALSADNNRSSEKSVADKQETKHSGEPRYVRINARDKFGEESWGDPETGGSVFETVWRDIDVSYDGKQWFHLMGGFCVKHEPPFREK